MQWECREKGTKPYWELLAAYSVTVTWPNRVHCSYLRRGCAPSAPLRCPQSRREHADATKRARTTSTFEHAEQQVCKHAEIFSRGFLDFKGGQRQREREQPTFIPVRCALAASRARAARLLPLEESRAFVLLPAVHDRLPAPSISTDAAASQSIVSSLQLTVLPLGSVEATLFIQQRQPQPRTGDIPGCLLGPRPSTVPLHLHRWVEAVLTTDRVQKTLY